MHVCMHYVTGAVHACVYALQEQYMCYACVYALQEQYMHVCKRYVTGAVHACVYVLYTGAVHACVCMSIRRTEEKSLGMRLLMMSHSCI